MGPGIVILGLAALGGLAMAARGRSRSSSSSVIRDTPDTVCSWSAQRAARGTETERFAWLACDGRTPQEAASMVARVRRDDPAAAIRAEERWNAIRAVVSTPPDGALTTTEAQAAARAVESGTVPTDSGLLGSVSDPAPRGGANPEEARRLVGPTIRALRARANYRSILRDFQRAAGITADGEYGPESKAALVRYGGQPPALWGRWTRQGHEDTTTR